MFATNMMILFLSAILLKRHAAARLTVLALKQSSSPEYDFLDIPMSAEIAGDIRLFPSDYFLFH